MPTYEYLCEICGHAFERLQKMSDDPVRECPACGSEGARRQISSGAGLLFKGPGFYATDYRKPDPGRSEREGKDGEGTDGGGGKEKSSTAKGDETGGDGGSGSDD